MSSSTPPPASGRHTGEFLLDDLARMSAEERDALRGEDIERAFCDADWSRLSTRYYAGEAASDGLLDRIGPDALRAGWRRMVAADPRTALALLEQLAAPTRAAFSAAEIAQAWRDVERGAERRFLALREQLACLAYIPEELRAEIDPNEVAQQWRRFNTENPSGTNLFFVLQTIPTELAREIGDGEIIDALVRYGYSSGRDVLTKTFWHVAPAVGREKVGDPYVHLWLGAAAFSPDDALEALRRIPPTVRDLIPQEAITRAWQRWIEEKPHEALEWWPRVPKKIRPEITTDMMQTLLQHSDSRVRLRMIGLAGKVAEERDRQARRQARKRPAP
jgi:hypothetical protein